jgi:hypothetical protein
VADFLYGFLGSLSVPKALAKRLMGGGLAEASRYYGHDPTRVVSSSFWFSSFVGFAVFVVILGLGLAPAFVASFVVVCLSLKCSTGYLPRRLKAERCVIAKHCGSVLDEIAFVLDTTGSVFEAMDVVASSGYPLISAEFRALRGQVENGQEPESVLLEYAYRQPSAAFREGLVELVSLHVSSGSEARDLASHVEREARGFFREFFFQVEARLTLFFGVLFFFPIVLAFVLIALDLASSVLVLLTIPVQILVAEVLSALTLKSQAGLVG